MPQPDHAKISSLAGIEHTATMERMGRDDHDAGDGNSDNKPLDESLGFAPLDAPPPVPNPRHAAPDEPARRTAPTQRTGRSALRTPAGFQVAPTPLPGKALADRTRTAVTSKTGRAQPSTPDASEAPTPLPRQSGAAFDDTDQQLAAARPHVRSRVATGQGPDTDLSTSRARRAPTARIAAVDLGAQEQSAITQMSAAVSVRQTVVEPVSHDREITRLPTSQMPISELVREHAMTEETMRARSPGASAKIRRPSEVDVNATSMVPAVVAPRRSAPARPATEDTRASGVFRATSMLAVMLLFFAAALPGKAGPPWVLLQHTNGVTFIGLAFMLLIVVAALAPVPRVARGPIATILAAAMVSFAWLMLVDGLAGDLYRGQPAMALLAESGWITRIFLTLALVALPFALLLRRLDQRSVASRVAFLIGLVLLMVLYTALNALDWPSGPPLSDLIDVGTGSRFLGDRVSAWLAFGPLVVATIGLVSLLPKARPGFAHGLAFGFWLTVAVPLVVIALFTAKSDAWRDVLDPLKLSTFCAVALIYLPAAMAEWAHRAPSANTPVIRHSSGRKD